MALKKPDSQTKKTKTALKTIRKKAASRGKKIITNPNRHHNDILNYVGIGIYISQGNKFVYVNPVFEEITGYCANDLIGKNPSLFIYPQDIERIRMLAIDGLQGKSSKPFEYRFIKKSGEVIWIIEKISSVNYGGKRAVLGSFMDVTEQKSIEETLRQSEDKYRSILENINDGYFETDLSGRFTFVNDALCNIHGYTEKELIGMDNRQYVDTANAKKAFTAFNEIYKSGKSGSIFDYEIITKNGRRKQVEVSASLIKDDMGNPVGFRGVTRDVTARKQTEESLRQSEEKYRSIIENIQEGYFELDLAGNYTFVNDANCRLLGYARNELIGMNALQHMPDEENYQTVNKAYTNLYLTGIPIKSLQVISAKKDGSPVMYETSVTIIRDAKGKPLGFRGVSRDITERKQMEEQLRQSEERYRSIIEQMADGYFETDLKGKFTFVNKAECRSTGYSREELIGKDSRFFADEAYYQQMRSIFIEVYKTNKPITAYDLELTKKNGKQAVHEMSVSLIKNKEGKITGFRGISRDVTERKAAETALRNSEEKYRTIIESINDAYYETDLSGNFIFFNDMLCKHLGYSREELIGRNSRIFQTDVNFEKTVKLYTDVYQTGNPTIGEIECVRKDKTIGIYELSLSLIRDKNGKKIGFRGISRDVTERKKMEEALRQSEEKYRTIMEEMNDAYFEVDLAGNYTLLSETSARLLGYSPGEMAGKNSLSFIFDDDIPVVAGAFNKIYKTGEPVRNIVYRAVHKDASIGIGELNGFPLKNEKGEIIGFRGIARDITERRQMEEKIHQSEERYRSIVEQMEDGYFETDLRGYFTFVNEAECRNLGYRADELIGMSHRQITDEKNAKALFHLFNSVYRTGKPVKAHASEVIKKDGTIAYNEISVALVKDAQGQPIGFRGISRDVTERLMREEKIQYIATHDALTCLPNRLLFGQLLNHAIESAKRNRRKLAVFFIDLDRFKIINDTLGHDAGDQLLQEIAARYQQTLRAMDVVARLGGDEFVVMIEEISDAGQAAVVAQKLIAATMKPVTIMREECRVTASIGISVYPKDGQDEQTLMKNADIAMYFAKEEGKNNYQFYSPDIKSKSIERLSIETQLRSALERNEFSLAYQAKIDFKTGVITGVEALLRWNNVYLHEVTPHQFIPVAEETGLIVPIGRWVLNTACKQNAAWQEAGLPPIRIAVNLSLRQLLDRFLLYDIEKALQDSGLQPDLLELEITESMVMHDPSRMIGVLEGIKKLGVRLAIDDFGTGYSSLAQLKHFPIDTLKIDRSFVRNLPNDSEDKAITEAIIAMGKTLSLTVVAEGVETEEQLNFLRAKSCDELQGFYFSKPIPPEQFAELLMQHVPAPLK
ncbi:MAG TPA: PAS domain S-box protein [Smithellaceae bacterium]|nr:PAS domain S-box protein [Smithellaceae bacterium]HRS88937.1 PAS domain S-box protein [Smithellaceae bacterium]HRV25553.1 PAS domain S-box protein [Smithellaceae bacterium]